MQLTFPILLEHLHGHVPTAFSRFGDGEFSCIFGKPGENVDHHTYFPDLGKALRGILESRPPYYIGIQPMARRIFSGDLTHGREFVRLSSNWYTNADLLHQASIRGQLGPFFSLLKDGRKICLVGPRYLSKLTVFPFELIEVPERNAWLQRKPVLDQCVRTLCSFDIFLFCAGMMSKPLIHSLYTLNEGKSYLDLGSLLDPYAGRQTRSYHRTLVLFPSTP